MKKPIKVLMLPTEDKQHAIIKKNTSILLKQTINLEYSGAKQHLYITVSQDIEPIKEGDWQLTNGVLTVRTDNYHENDRKVIATTDPKLYTNEIVEEDLHMYKKPLPQVPQSFIEEFVANPDGEFEVEYEEVFRKVKAQQTEPSKKREITFIQSDGYKLKLNQDNEVNVTAVDNVLANAEIVYRKVYGACGKDTNVSGVLPSYISFWEQMNSITSVEKEMYSLSDLEKLGDYAFITAKSTSDWNNWIKENL